MQINRQLYERLLENFEDGNGSINATFRHVFVCDDEQTRIEEELANLSRDEWWKLWEPMTVAEIEMLEFSIMTKDWAVLEELLSPYISNRRLWDMDQQLWQDLLFSPERPWEDFCAEQPANVIGD